MSDFKDLVEQDWQRLLRLSQRPEKRFRLYNALNPRFGHIYCIRMALALYQSGWHRLAKVVSLILVFVFRIEISTRIIIGPGLVIPHAQGLVIGAVEIGSDVTIFQNTTLGARFSDFIYDATARPKIGNSVTIGAGVSVLGAVTVGDYAVLAANSLILDDVAEHTTVIGVPAVVQR